MAANTNNTKKPSLGLVLAGLVIGALAETVLLFPWGKLLDGFRPLSAFTIYTTTGVFLYVLAGFLFMLGLRRQGERLPVFSINMNAAPQSKSGFGFWIISLSLAGAIAIHASYAPTDDQDGYLFAGMWIFSIAILVFGTLREADWRPPTLMRIREWVKAHRAELFIITTIVLVAFLIRVLDVELHPYSFINDEGQVGSGGECILQGKCVNFFSLGWAAQPEPAFFPYAVSIWLFGRTAFAVRLVSVIVGTLSVLAVYLLAREIFDKKIAWLSALLLAILPVHVHFSRTGVDNIVDSLTAPLVLWLLFRGVKRGSRLSFLAAGIVAGFCIYTYPGSLLAPAFGISALGLLALQTRGFLRAHYKNILIFILAATVVVTPILGYYATNSTFFLARFKKEGILENGGLQKQIETTGQSAAVILLQQFTAASLVFISRDAPLNFFNSPRAYFPPIEAVIFMFGLAYILWWNKDPRCKVIFLWFWAVVILGGALTGSPPTSQRILMSLPAAVMMTAIGMVKILDTFVKLRPSVVKFAPGILLGFVLLMGYTEIHFYFYDYRIGHYYEDIRNEITYETRVYTTPLHKQGRLFLIANSKTPYLQYKSFDYFAPDVEKVALDNITLEMLRKLPYDKDALFIALPDHKSDLELIAQLIPGGEWHEVRRRYQPQDFLFYTYKITKEQLAVFTSFAGGYDKLRP
jgi:hypothetical protein